MKIAIAILATIAVGCVNDVEISFKEGTADAGPTEAPTIGEHVWSRTLGGIGENRVRDIAIDSAGDTIVVGEYSRTIDLGSGTATTTTDHMGYVAKYRGADGAPLWSVAFANEGVQDIEGLTRYSGARRVVIAADDRVLVVGNFGRPVDFGGGLVEGSNCGNGFLAVYSSEGGLERLVILPGVRPTDMVLDEPGNLFVSGRVMVTDCEWFREQNGTVPAEHRSFLTKYDASVTEVWTKQFTDRSGLTGLAVAPNGDVVVTGNFGGTIDFGGGSLVSTVHPNLGEAFVARLTTDGYQVWAQSFGGPPDGSSSVGTAVSVGSDNGVYIAGSFGGAIDFGGQWEYTNVDVTGVPRQNMYLLRLDALGNRDWFLQQPGAAIDLEVRQPGRVLVTGRATRTTDFGGGPTESGAFVVSFDLQGNHIGSQGFPMIQSRSGAAGTAVEAMPSGGIIVAGLFEGTSDFGGGMVSSASELQHDGFIAVFQP